MQKVMQLLAFTVLSVTAYPAYSNGKLLPGYYIQPAGDTIACNIDFEDWYVNPKTVHAEAGGRDLRFGPGDIKGFGITGYGDYVSATVSYHLNEIARPNLPEQFSDSTNTEECFLKVLEKGRYALYELVLPNRFYYYIGDTDGRITELVYRVVQKDLEINEDLTYKVQLSALFTKEGLLQQYQHRISYAHYNGPSILSLVGLLNGGRGGSVPIARTAKQKLVELSLFAGGALESYPLAVKGQVPVPTKFSSSLVPTGGVNLEFILPNHYRSVRVGLSASYLQYSGSDSKSGSYVNPNNGVTYGYSEKLHFKRSDLLATVYGSYAWFFATDTRVFVKAGIVTHMKVSGDAGILSDNLYYGETVSFNNIFFQWTGAIGVGAGRSKLEAAYFLPAHISTTEGKPFKIAMAVLSYYYTIAR
jgi:hypothetical protein